MALQLIKQYGHNQPTLLQIPLLNRLLLNPPNIQQKLLLLTLINLHINLAIKNFLIVPQQQIRQFQAPPLNILKFGLKSLILILQHLDISLEF